MSNSLKKCIYSFKVIDTEFIGPMLAEIRAQDGDHLHANRTCAIHVTTEVNCHLVWRETFTQFLIIDAFEGTEEAVACAFHVGASLRKTAIEDELAKSAVISPPSILETDHPAV